MNLRLFSVIILLIYISLEYLFKIDFSGIHYLRNFTLFIFVFSFIHPLLFKNVYLKKAQKLNIYDFIQYNQSTLPKNSDLQLWVINKRNVSSFSFNIGNTSHIIINQKYLDKLSLSEIRFIIFHELHHIIKKDIEKNVISWAIVIAFIPFVLINLPILHEFNIIIGILFLLTIYGITVTLHFLLSRKREYNADKFAEKNTSPIIAKKTLDHVKEMEGIKESVFSLYNTHPTINKRKSRLTNS